MQCLERLDHIGKHILVDTFQLVILQLNLLLSCLELTQLVVVQEWVVQKSNCQVLPLVDYVVHEDQLSLKLFTVDSFCHSFQVLCLFWVNFVGFRFLNC